MEVPEQLAGLDLSTALSRVGGDEELLKEIAEIFLEQCPEDLHEVRSAIEASDAGALEHAAHSLKGSVGNFGARQAFEAALRLEKMGRSQELSNCNQALIELEKALEELKPQLCHLTAS